MTRSRWKFFYVDPILMYQFFYVKILPLDEDVLEEPDVISVWSRNSIILPEFVGSFVEIHNGKSFFFLRITSDMIRHKMGEFALTKRTGANLHIVKKKK